MSALTLGAAINAGLLTVNLRDQGPAMTARTLGTAIDADAQTDTHVNGVRR